MSGVAAGGVRGELARSEFLMSRRKIVKGQLAHVTLLILSGDLSENASNGLPGR